MNLSEATAVESSSSHPLQDHDTSIESSQGESTNVAGADLSKISIQIAAPQTKTATNDETSPAENVAKRKAIDLESDSEIEDVTYQYVKKKRPASPEIIEVEDVSSDEECSDAKQSCAQAKCSEKNDGNVHGLDENDSDANSDGESCDMSSDSYIEDVTEFMLAKRKEELLQEIDGAIELGDSDSEADTNNTKKCGDKKKRSPSRHRKRRKILHPPIEVLIDAKDIPQCPGQKCTDTELENDNTSTGPSQDDVDHTIKQRIVKLLNTGFHSESNENEAKNAMKLARRLMERYNLDQSVLLRERGDGSLNDFSTLNGDKDGSTLGGGIVVVNICNRKKGKVLSSLPRWMDFLVQPICANFHVDAFKSLVRATKYNKTGECTISFYGIRTNAQLAAYAFKIASERISLMAASYEPPVGRGGSTETKNVRLSYALGITIGLDRSVTEELRKEEKRRKSRLNKARRAGKSDACSEDSDDDKESTVDEGDDFDNPIDLTLEQLESENAAQLALIDHQKKIAEEVLKVSSYSIHPCTAALSFISFQCSTMHTGQRHKNKCRSQAKGHECKRPCI